MIETHAKIAFRHLPPEAREEAIQEVVCNACVAFARLEELNKANVARAGVLATFAVRQTRVGRKVGSKLNCRDVLSPYCQRKKNLRVERLDTYGAEAEVWAEMLVEDKHAGPAETAISRIDFSTWLQLLPRRLRKIALFLANGETTSATARRFRLSQGRVSHIRRELCLAWHQFQGDAPGLAVV